MKELYEQDLEDIVNGAIFLGSGGGGSRELGHQLAQLISCPVQLIDVEELGADDWGAVILGIGAADGSLPDTPPSLRIFSELLLNQARIDCLKTENNEIDILFSTFAHLEKILKMEKILKKFSYSLAVEIGTANVLVAMLTAAKYQIPIVDADGAGRAVPELNMCTYYWCDIPIHPFVLANVKSDRDEELEELKAVIYAKTSPVMARLTENLVRTKEFASQAIMVAYAMSGETVRHSKPVITGTISKVQKIGSTLRKAKEQKKHPPTVLLDFLNNSCSGKDKSAFLLFEGTISEVNEQDEQRFQKGTLTLKNGDEEVCVDYLNENLLARRNGQPIAMGPDLICYLTPDGTPLTNAELKEKKGTNLLLIGLKAPQELRQDSIVKEFMGKLALFEYYGEYVPIEQLQSDMLKQ